MRQKITLLCGGMSPEHEISLLSAKNIARHLDPEIYELQIVYLALDGKWWMMDDNDSLLSCDNSVSLLKSTKKQVLPDFGSNPASLRDYNTKDLYMAGVVIPMLHGSGGEDGSVQGVLQLWKVKHIGPKVLGCAITMNKAVTKSLLAQAGITCVPWQLLIRPDLELLKDGSLDITINFPIFVKPVDTGSSIGVARVCDNSELIKAIEEAFKYSGEVILEPEIKGRELECAVLSGMSYATVPGEVLINKNYEFYDYQAKYEDVDASKTIVPADISDELSSKMRSIALRAAMVLRADMMSRVDFFIDEERNIYVNEVNSIPGFTDISMYSKLWQHSGISMPQLLDHLINQVSV